MSIVEPTLLSLARAATVALATLAMLLIAGPSVGSASRQMRALFLWLSLATLLMPGFAIGFTHFGNAMKQDAFGRGLLHCLFTWLRFSPLALLVVWLMPPSFSGEAEHCLRIGTSLPWWARRKWELRAWGRSLWLGAALVFLLAFQEFEIATTWNLRAWPVALFDAQAGGLALRESLRLASLPFAIQAALIAGIAVLLRDHSRSDERQRAHTARSAILWIIAPTGFMLLVIFPFVAIACGSSTLFYSGGIKAFELVPWRETWNAIGVAAAATTLAWLFSGWIENGRRSRWLFALPGLLGPMLCGLVLLAMLQVSPFHRLRDTVFPVVCGLALVLLPLALLLRFGIGSTRDSAALHIARTSGARCARWQIEGRPAVYAMLMLFCCGCGDFTINSLLAPPQFTNASVRLLNLLHYGRSDMLLIMFTMAFAVPFAVALFTAFIARFHPLRRAS